MIKLSLFFTCVCWSSSHNIILHKKKERELDKLLHMIGNPKLLARYVLGRLPNKIRSWKPPNEIYGTDVNWTLLNCDSIHQALVFFQWCNFEIGFRNKAMA